MRLLDIIDRFEAYGLARPAAMALQDLRHWSPDARKRFEGGALSGFEPEPLTEEAWREYTDGWKSIVGLAVPYSLLPACRRPEPGQCSRVSIMAWEWDYHRVIREMAEAVMGEVPFKLHVDSGPLPERYFAQQMGLARPGRSQMLIHSQYGTAFYLAFVLTQLEAEPERCSDEGLRGSEPARPQAAFGLADCCRDCRRCQAHCPGGALFGERDFAAGRCVSAITQKKGRLAEADMRLMGRQLYGCDLCQLSCPANRPLAREAGKFPLMRQSFNGLDPGELIQLSQKAFKAAYGCAGFSWRGLKTIKRNALINMGNSGDQRWRKTLLDYMNCETDEGLIETAAWALEALPPMEDER